MASRYDSPLKIETDISPLAMPSELMKQGLANQQQRYDTILGEAQSIGDRILEQEARPGVKDDIDFITATYDEYASERDRMLGSLDGDFSSTRVTDITKAAQDILLPKREAIQAVAHNNNLWKERQILKEKLRAEGKLLDFTDELETKSTVNPDGTVNVFHSVGVESRGDWLGGINKLFANIQNNSLIEKIYDDSGTSDDMFTYIKGLMRKVSSNEQILKSDGTTFSPNIIQNVIDNAIDSFIDADQDGNQMYRWFMNYYKKEALGSNPDMSDEEAMQYADSKARKRIQDAIANTGDKYRNRQESIEDLLEVQRNPIPRTNSTGSGTGKIDKPTIPSVLGVNTLSYVPGSEFTSHGEYQEELRAFDAPFTDTDDVWNKQYEEIKSIPQALAVLTNVGPSTEEESNRYSQFQHRSTATKGKLQSLDESRDGYRGSNNRSVYELGESEVDKYIDYLVQSGRLNRSDENDKRIISKIRDDASKSGGYKVSTLLVNEAEDGSISITMDPYFQDNSQVGDRVSSFMRDNEKAIAEYAYHIDNLRGQKRVLLERQYQAMTNARFSSREEFEQKFNANPGFKAKINNIDTEYYAGIIKAVANQVQGPSPYPTERILGLVNSELGSDYVTAIGKTYQKIAESDNPEQYVKEYTARAGSDVQPFSEEFWDYVLSSSSLDKTVTKNGNEINASELIARYSSLSPRLNPANGINSYTKPNVAKVKENLLAIDNKRAAELSRLDPQLKKYYDTLEEMSTDYYVNGNTFTIPGSTTEEKSKFFAPIENAIHAAIMGHNNMFKVKPDPDEESRGRSYTLAEALAEQEEEVDTSKLRDYYNVTGIRFDAIDGLVVDLQVGKDQYEVRDIAALDHMLSNHYGMNAKTISYMKQASTSLKNNDGVHGRLGEIEEYTTDFFVAQVNDDKVTKYEGGTLKKGEYYIYTGGGQKLGFSSMKNLIDWHTDNKDADYSRFVKEASPLALPRKEFEVRYPGIDRDEYEKKVLERITKNMSKYQYGNSQLVYFNGINTNDVYVAPVGEGEQNLHTFVKPLSFSPAQVTDDIKFLAQESGIDLSKASPNEDISIQPQQLSTEDMSSLGLAPTSSRGIVAVPAFKSAFKKLRDLGFDHNLTVTNSLRSINEHNAIYRSNGKEPIKYSKHFHGLSLDIRSQDYEGTAFIEFMKSESGQQWLKDNKLVALVHEVQQGGWHIDLSYDVGFKFGNVTHKPKPYIFKDEQNDIIINK